jgi:hypothetical protein
MRKLIKRRPSAGTLIAFVALFVALGGAAFAASKLAYKGLSKDARLKVLPVSATNANTSGTDCDPTSSTTFTKCTQVSLNTSSQFPRRVLLVFNGTFDSSGAPGARGDCRLELDNNPLTGTTIKVEPRQHTAGYGDGYGINIVTTPQGGNHTYSVACNEAAGDLRVKQFQLSAATVR